ncbi:flagella basal body P-ring formation protein FlgA [Candidatus Endobugula sertula]|uniref:Flagella basal body P-ring formation protein FlgA n=1 Tax=Candidatus Endobugula sertula TaxID=62101 RepID=A0A1D2QQI0_9GAMM|nr:flagella basal body P-ring formation protein FlgA [Candidatus Endobugula sertula]
MKARNYLCFFSLFLFINNSWGSEYTDLAHLVRLSENYLQQQLYKEIPFEDRNNIKISSRPLDYRLKLAPCDKSLTFKDRYNQPIRGNISIKVSCQGINSWAVYIKHRVGLEKDILVLKTDLPKNHILRKEDLSTIKRDIYTLRSGYLNNSSLIVGHQLKRALKAGTMIYHSVLLKPHIIKKGDTINIVAQLGSLSVITPGIALKGGHKGEQIDVENRLSSRIIRAEIVGPNTVAVVL